MATRAKAASAADLDALDLAHLFHPNTNLAALHKNGPLVLARGKGIHVWDTQGKQYIEGMAGLWCTTLGYGDEELASVAYEQLKTLAFTHLFAGKSHEPAVRLADKLVRMAPFAASRVFFGNSGSDANDTQIKLAWYYNNAVGRPAKKKIIARQRGYHGTTLASAGLTGLPSFHKNFDVPLPGILHTDAPYYYRGAQPGESQEDYATRLANNLEQLILREDPDTIAAFFAEPLMGVGGVLLPPKTYFEKIQAVLAKYDVLLIDDEVITGFGRTGEIWGAQAFGMQPNTVTAAKALSSAYLPISAVIVPEFLYEPMIEASGQVGLFGHGFTYSGHPVSAAVALRALEIYEERKLYEHVRNVAPKFQQRLQALATHALVGDARGIGLLGAVELVRNKETKVAFDSRHAVGAKCMALCQERGLIVRAIGDVVALCPPFIVKPKDVDDIFDRLGDGLDDTLAWAQKEGLA
ncbi:MAG TPA: aminotransferase [Gammaproteobacteria bacterium]|nr:aminotransferase [Gammaproteobacteria bacterium]